jgi:hypothetical protein
VPLVSDCARWQFSSYTFLLRSGIAVSPSGTPMKNVFRLPACRPSAGLVSTIILAGGVGCAPVTPAASTPVPVASTGSNPLFAESTLPYHAPRFDLIRNEHYQPALEEGMRRNLAEIDAIAKQTQPPTFENTIVAMERSRASMHSETLRISLRSRRSSSTATIATSCAPARSYRNPTRFGCAR